MSEVRCQGPGKYQINPSTSLENTTLGTKSLSLGSGGFLSLKSQFSCVSGYLDLAPVSYQKNCTRRMKHGALSCGQHKGIS